MSTNTMLPFPTRPWVTADGQALPVKVVHGLNPTAVKTLRATFPGVLTPQFERFLHGACGLEGTALQYIDFTGQWHDEEPLAVFRPCITLGVDAKGRRWIAETGQNSGLPGPIWCICRSPEVAVYVAGDLGEFLEALRAQTCAQTLDAWLNSLDSAADRAWKHRGALAFQSRQDCAHDRNVRAWLLQLPRDARVYDLRSPAFGAAWPYGAAGAAGRLHRCGREPLFAVSGFPAPSRWADYLADLAISQEMPKPAVLAFARERAARSPIPQPRSAAPELRRCA